jgi:hypothetical protein
VWRMTSSVTISRTSLIVIMYHFSTVPASSRGREFSSCICQVIVLSGIVCISLGQDTLKPYENVASCLHFY